MFKEMFTNNTITEGFFGKMKNKLRFAGNDLGDYKHYYEYSGKNGLVARLEINNYDTGEDVVNYSREDIMGGITKHSVTIEEWYKDGSSNKHNAGWLEYQDDEQGRAFKFLQSIYKKDTKVKLRHKTEYILNDVLMTYGSGKELSIAKQKFNSKNDLVKFVGKTTDGDDIAFNPTEIKR